MREKLSQLKPLHWVLIVLFVFLGYELIFQPGGLIRMIELESQLHQQEAKNAILNQQNQDLEKKVMLMQASDRSIEGEARSELGMVKKGEVFYQAVH